MHNNHSNHNQSFENIFFYITLKFVWKQRCRKIYVKLKVLISNLKTDDKLKLQTQWRGICDTIKTIYSESRLMLSSA